MSMHPGCVYLVGAGPGDPGLLTLRGRELLDQADVVVYDYLAHPSLLSYCPRAEKVFAGKQAAAHSMTQQQINQVLIDHGRLGKQVVRLKGGDPFVFGRGGEECAALANAGVPFEVVPGVTSAIAAAAYAGIPVTHRDLNSSFTLITGHEKEQAYQEPEARARAAGETATPPGASDQDWSALAKLPALAFYMGVKSLPRICQKLIDHGMPAHTPAATIQWGTLPRQRTVVGTISTLPQRVFEAGVAPPALTVVGRVVDLRATLNWFESRPLFGKRVAVTRTRQQVSELARMLESLGAQVIEAPMIQLADPLDMRPIDDALQRAGEYDWVVFTSANGVESARRRLLETGLDARAFGKARVAAIGEVTAEAVRQRLALKVDVVPDVFMAEELAEAMVALGDAAGKRVLLLRADVARPVLVTRLREAGAAEVCDVAIYRTLAVETLPEDLRETIESGQLDWITFASSGTVKSFMRLADGLTEKLAAVKVASIGPITSQTLRALGLPPTVEAEPFTVPALVRAMAAHETRTGK